jgi:hypothetical protein
MTPEFKPKALLAALDAQRMARRMTWPEVAHALGIASGAILELPEREVLETDDILQMTRWLGLNIESFVGEARDRAPGPDPGDVRSSGRRLRFDNAALFAALDARRRAEGLTWPQVSEAIGAKRATPFMLAGLHRASRIDLYTMLAIIHWLDQHSSRFTRLSGG